MSVLRRSVSMENSDVTDSGERPEISSYFLHWLASDSEAAKHINPLGIRVYNATVTSPLQLSYFKLPFALEFQFCTFKEAMSFKWADIQSIYLFHCKIDSIWADGVRVMGDVAVNSCEAGGKVSLIGAKISGNLDCSGTKFIAAKGETLDASGAKVTGSIYLASANNSTPGGETFTSTGTIMLIGCEISGSLVCSGAVITASGNGLVASDATIKGNVFMQDGFTSTGAIQFAGTDIGGNLICSGARLPQKGDALIADATKIRNVYLDNSFSSPGSISLLNAQIDGDPNCSGADIFGHLICDRMRVGARMIYMNIANPKWAQIDLFGASVGALHDDEESWPDELSLDGFVYQELVLH